MNNFHTSLPGQIIVFDGKRAVVKPALNKRLSDGSSLAAPQIVDVPVCFPVGDGGKAQITVPLKVGDDVMLNFSERSLENWLSGSNDAPDDPRRYDLSDCFASPMVRPTKTSIDKDNVSISYGDAYLKITPSGDINIKCKKYTVNATEAEINSAEITLKGSLLSILSAVVSHLGTGIGKGHKHNNVKAGKDTSGSVS